MNDLKRLKVWLAVLAAAVVTGYGSWVQALEMSRGQTVVFLGDTLIERSQEYGYLEAMFTVSFPEAGLKFRNLGWSADDVEGQSRAGFDHLKPRPGWVHLIGAVREADPDWVVLGYGMAESFGGQENLASFRDGLGQLVKAIQGLNSGKEVGFIFLSPIGHEKIPGALPDPREHNLDLKIYSEAVKKVADEVGAPFVDLFSWLNGYSGPEKLTDNGIHLNGHGYREMARYVGLQLGLSGAGSVIEVEEAEKSVRKVVPATTHHLITGGAGLGDYRLYVLRIDGRAVHAASGAAWKSGIVVDSGPASDRAADLASEIVDKNELFFYRWRPQNNTYLFLFRKHEQGQNAREIPMFDPLIEEAESSIAQLAGPGAHEFILEVHSGPTGPVLDPPRPVEVTGSVVPGFEGATQALPEFTVAEGYKISLFASNPLLAKPIHMNFDPDGRLWVASSEVYPQIEPGQSANDKVIVLEDLDGDGVADESRVFADGLLIPTGVAAGDGGVYVGHSTELLHLKDTDGDGIADKRRIVLSGFGTEDTHHILHTLRWGPEGMLYMNQSIYIHTHMETPHGVVRLKSGGVIQLQPSTMKAGIYVKGFCNPWGHHFDPFGQSFITDGAGYQGVSLAVPGAMYFTYAGAPRTMDSISPGSYPKFCGLELVRSPIFPADWQGDAITCDFRAHKVVRFSMADKGSAYETTQQPDLVATDDVTFRPIDVKFGPDGALYIADWSNPIIQHGEVDFRDPRRDHVNGRIWRVAPIGGKAVKTSALTALPNMTLMNNLQSEHGFKREQSRRVLTERGQSILPDLEEWIRRQRDDHSRLEALWLYQSLNLAEPSLLALLLESDDERIRAAAVRAVSYWPEELPASVDLIKALADPHPRVRMEALRVLAIDPAADSMARAVSVLDHPMDNHLDYALWLTVNDLSEAWISSVEDGAVDPTSIDTDKLAYILKSLPAGSAGRVLNQVLSAASIPADGSGPWLPIIGQAGASEQIRSIYQKLLQGYFNEKGQSAVLDALNEAARARRIVPGASQGDLRDFLESDSAATRMAAIRVAGAWKNIQEAFGVLATYPVDAFKPENERIAAIDSLREIGGAGAVSALVQTSSEADNKNVRLRSAMALASLDTEKAWVAAQPLFAMELSDNEITGVWRSLLQVRDAGDKLEPLARVATLPERVAELGVRVAGEGGRQLPGLVIALNRAGGLEGKIQLTSEDFAFLARRAGEQGDPHRGELVYRRNNLACTTCHAIGGIGGMLGPDLTSIGASAPADYLVESLYAPNAKIKEGYHAINVDTIAELTYSGTLVREDAGRLWLRDAASKVVEIPKDEIVSRVMADYSLMPSGLIDGLNDRDRLDLVAFLSRLGKVGDFDASKPDRARRWYLFPATIDAAQFGEEKILNSDLADNASWRGGWKSFDTLVNGNLPEQALKQRLREVSSRFPNKLYAGSIFQSAQAGEILFDLQGFDSIECKAWIDGAETPIHDGSIKADLEAGRHTVILSLPVDPLPQHISIQSSQVTFIAQ